MKKIILTLLLLSTAAIYANAQEATCECNEPAVAKSKIVDLCPIFYFHNEPGPDPMYPNGVPAEYLVWVEFKWEERVCNGQTYINLTHVTLNTPLFNYMDLFNTGQISWPEGRTPWNQCALVAGGGGLGGPGHPTDPNDYNGMNAYMDFLVQTYGPKGNNGLPGTIVEGGCKELVVVAWPSGAGVFTPGGDLPGGGTAAPIFRPLTTGYTWVNCPGTSCCSWKVGENGRPHTIIPSSETECFDKVRDPQYVPTVNTQDQFGNPITINGNVIFGYGCKPSCPVYNPYGSFTSSLSKIEVPIELNASPTLVESNINFTANMKITSTTVFDMKGSKVNGTTFNNNVLNVENLKTGIYFIQVQFENKQIRTIKIAKQ